MAFTRAQGWRADMSFVNAVVAFLLGVFVGKLISIAVYFLPRILLEGCDKGRVPRDIFTWYFQNPLSLSRNNPEGVRALILQGGVGLFFGLSAFFFPFDAALFFVLIANSILVCCFITDYEYGILPDQFTITLVWVGLLGSLFPIFVKPEEAIAGAVCGYGVFWVLNEVYRYFRGFEGMYPGDFKLNAGIGACVGIKWLLPILFASLVLLIVVTAFGLILKRKTSGREFLYKEIPYACTTTAIAATVNLLLLFMRQE